MDWDLILRALDGSCSEDDNERLRRWIDTDEKHRKILDQLRIIWNADEETIPKPDTERALETVIQRTGLTEKSLHERLELQSPTSVPHKEIKSVFRMPSVRILRIAALLLITLGAVYFGSRILKPGQMQEIHVAFGDQKSITLPDRTQVTLDSGSRFRYPRVFRDRDRTVTLTGEAVFQTAHDPDRPFSIEAHHALITVLGTEFNVRAWQRNEAVEVAVVRGRVSMQAERDVKGEDKIVIETGQMGRVGEDGKLSTPETIDVDEYLGWLHREKRFERTPLREVLDQVERWYDLDCVLSDTSFAQNRITVFLEKKPVEEILEMLALVNGFTFKRERNTITFSPR